MKEIKVYIQPFMLQKVTDALHKMHIHGMSVCEMKGFGREKDEAYPHYSGDYITEFTPKIKLEIICSDEEVERIVEIIKADAHTGRKGDGKIFVADIEKAVSIRTGETGNQAI